MVFIPAQGHGRSGQKIGRFLILALAIAVFLALVTSSCCPLVEARGYTYYPDDEDYNGLQIYYGDTDADIGYSIDDSMGSLGAAFLFRTYYGEANYYDYVRAHGGFRLIDNSWGIKYFVGTVGIYNQYSDEPLGPVYTYTWDASYNEPYPTFDHYFYYPNVEALDLKMELIGTDDEGRTWDLRVIYHLDNNFYKPSATPTDSYPGWDTPTPYAGYPTPYYPTPTSGDNGGNPTLDPEISRFLEEMGMGDLPLIGAGLFVCLYAVARMGRKK